MELFAVEKLCKTFKTLQKADFGIFFDVKESHGSEFARAGLVVIGRLSAKEVGEIFRDAGLSEAIESNCLVMDLPELERRLKEGDPYLIEVVRDPSRHVCPVAGERILDRILRKVARPTPDKSQPDSPTVAGFCVPSRETHPTPCA